MSHFWYREKKAYSKKWNRVANLQFERSVFPDRNWYWYCDYFPETGHVFAFLCYILEGRKKLLNLKTWNFNKHNLIGIL